MASPNPGRNPIGGELAIPAGALGFTLYYFSTIVDSPWTAQVSAFFVGAVLLILVAIFFVKSALALKRGDASLGLDSLVAPLSLARNRVALLGLTIAYIFVIEWGGFTLTSFLFLFAAMVLLGNGRNKAMALCLSASLAVGGYLLFILAFETRFPEGPFERLVKTVF